MLGYEGAEHCMEGPLLLLFWQQCLFPVPCLLTVQQLKRLCILLAMYPPRCIRILLAMHQYILLVNQQWLHLWLPAPLWWPPVMLLPLVALLLLWWLPVTLLLLGWPPVTLLPLWLPVVLPLRWLPVLFLWVLLVLLVLLVLHRVNQCS